MRSGMAPGMKPTEISKEPGSGFVLFGGVHHWLPVRTCAKRTDRAGMARRLGTGRVFDCEIRAGRQRHRHQDYFLIKANSLKARRRVWPEDGKPIIGSRWKSFLTKRKGQAMEDGAEKDPRVYFAAERTFLAWIRTGLGLMGAGFAVSRFGLFLREVQATEIHMPVSYQGSLSLVRNCARLAGCGRERQRPHKALSDCSRTEFGKLDSGPCLHQCRHSGQHFGRSRTGDGRLPNAGSVKV